jgi:predicted nucleotidyltransferase component of viral defense system
MRKSLKKFYKEVVLKLSDFLKAGNFYLAGGTAVYYYLNHRLSEDLDFFTFKKFDFREWKGIFEESEILEFKEDTIHCLIEGVKVSFFHYPYKLLKETFKFDMIELASLEDILAMKTSAIIQRDSKKDFVDVYYIMKELQCDSKRVIEIFRQKYGEFNPLIIKKTFVYFEDADDDPELKMIKPVTWIEVKEFFIEKFTEV